MAPPEGWGCVASQRIALVLMQVSETPRDHRTGEFCGKTEVLPPNATWQLFEDKVGALSGPFLNFFRTSGILKYFLLPSCAPHLWASRACILSVHLLFITDS